MRFRTYLPGMKARKEAPAKRGTRIVFIRDCTKGLGAMRIVPLAAPKTADSMKGIVKMPSKFEPTVKSNARAVFPPTACRYNLLYQAYGRLEASIGCDIAVNR